MMRQPRCIITNGNRPVSCTALIANHFNGSFVSVVSFGAQIKPQILYSNCLEDAWMMGVTNATSGLARCTLAPIRNKTVQGSVTVL